MKRIFILILSLVSITVPAASQVSYNSISATVTDSAGHPFAFAQLTAVLVTSAGFPAVGVATPNGQLFNGSPAYTTLDSTGHFSVQLMQNGLLHNPTGTKWRITLSSPQDSSIIRFDQAWNLTYTFTVTGDADISSQLNSLVTSTISFLNMKTGQSTLAGAGGGLPVNNPVYTGLLSGPTVKASVNTQINVMADPYNAKGDCVTDDTAAFVAAQNAALAYQGLPASIFLPKPPGGCYIVNDFVWQGASLIGQPSGIAGAGSHKYNVMLASSPGHDILHVPDPLTASSRVTLYGGWQILNVTFSVGNTTAPAIASVKHRWPGRWSDDSNVTSGSQIITVSSSTPFTCGDVGQAITVGGAGATATTDTLAAAITTTTAKTVTLTTGLTASWPSIFAYIKIDSEIMLVEVQDYTNGTVTFTNVQRAQAGTTAATHAASAAVTVMGNLTTTLASVSPCWVSPTTPSFTTVKLTAAATTTISNAHTYLSVLGLPVTENIGNCAIAMDMQDGLSSDWNTTLLTDVRPKMDNVFFETATGDTSNDVCGIYTQGNPTLYGLQMSNFMFYKDKFAIVQATSELNAYQQSSSGDYEHWLDGIFFFDWAPWISYNGLSQNFDNVQQSSSAGFQILNASNSAFDSSCDWHMKNMGMEADGASTYGWHVTGCEIAFNAVAFTSGSQIAYLDTNNSTCTSCSGIISLNGYGNHGEWGSITSISGFDNSTSTSYIGNPVFGYPAGYDISGLPYKGKYNLVGRFTADFAFDENTVGTYNKDDLILWPQDFLITPQSNWTTTIIADSTSPSGYYINMASPSAGSLSQWAQFVDQGQNTGNHSIYVGSTIPDTGVDIYFQAKCPSGTSSFTFSAFVWGATGSVKTFSCSTTYQNYMVAFPFTTAANGSWFGLQQGGATEWDVSYFVVVPWKNFNGKSLAGAGAAIPTGPATSATNDVLTYADLLGTTKDSGIQISSVALISQLPATQLASAGNCFNSFTAASALFGSTTCGTGTVSTGSGYAIPFYGSGSSTVLGPSNIKSDSSGNNLSVPGSVAVGASPPTACGSAVGCDAANEGSTAGTPTAGQQYCRADSTTHKRLCSLNGGAETPIALVLSGTTASIGGGALTAGTCATGTVTITGAVVGMDAHATPTTYPGAAFEWNAYISAANTVTVSVCTNLAAGGTPTASTYNVRVTE